MSENPYSELDDASFLRYIAQNDYMIDGNFLPEGINLNNVADRIERTHKLLVEQTQKAIEAVFNLRQSKRDSQEAMDRLAQLDEELGL